MKKLIRKEDIEEICFNIHKTSRVSDLTENLHLWNAIHELKGDNWYLLVDGASTGVIERILRRAKRQWQRKNLNRLNIHR